MRPSLALASRLANIQLTLFTRANCGLCDVAKARIGEFLSKNDNNNNKGTIKNENKDESSSKSKSSRVVRYAEIDIMDPAHSKWRDVYDFDVPVLHVDRSETGKLGDPDRDFVPTLDAARKLMHRFTVQEVENAVVEVEQQQQRGSGSDSASASSL
ncbi:hypothetical protein AYO21_02007 [Fonsecaea monophora]|uniref:Glutaredoxin-like protein n=1 Tax=Fonsecaea monophora TaxID=254056 RepID=A0A177FJH3_9EURO|nr:hypothetical protein AYO21_02007 [Fonsecaea monophora]OAG43780.1 hypothetical protein AYO21_02007 [Fonsecaea monophora]